MKTLKLALLGATFLAGAAASAQAADIYRDGGYKDPPVAPVEYLPAITWTGFYFGGDVGAAFNDDNSYMYLFEDDETFDDGNDNTTWLAGVHVGYNWQNPTGLVLGLEGDVSFADNIDYLASIRGRIGYAMNSTMVYATGGAAFMGLERDLFDDDTVEGWVAGVGLEHKLAQNLSVGLEGLYYNFGDGSDHDIPGGFYHEDDKDFWVVRARVSYHFGGGAY